MKMKLDLALEKILSYNMKEFAVYFDTKYCLLSEKILFYWETIRSNLSQKLFNLETGPRYVHGNRN